MGFLYKAVCYPDLPTVKQHYAADLFTQWGSGPSIHTSEVISFDAESATFELCRRTDGGTCTVAVHQFPTFSACDWSGSTEVTKELFYALLLLVVLAFCANRLFSTLWRPHEPM